MLSYKEQAKEIKIIGICPFSPKGVNFLQEKHEKPLWDDKNILHCEQCVDYEVSLKTLRIKPLKYTYIIVIKSLVKCFLFDRHAANTYFTQQTILYCRKTEEKFNAGNQRDGLRISLYCFYRAMVLSSSFVTLWRGCISDIYISIHNSRKIRL